MNWGTSSNEKFLFVLKAQQNYSELGYTNNPKSGLITSVKMVVNLLTKVGRKADIEVVADGNDVDRVVTKHRPTVVVIEALWVTPDKIKELQRLHPDVIWVIRIHSEIPFLANEGIALSWLLAYQKIPNTFIAANSLSAQQALYQLDPGHVVHYLPNYYEVDQPKFSLCAMLRSKHKRLKEINVGCFGAIRPMKNQLAQAIAAVTFADRQKVKLRFHINATRLENSGAENVLKNIRGLFAAHPEHELVEHSWLEHSEFINLIRKMDLMLQVSMSETFNIVTADAVAVKVPVVVGPTIDWIDPKFHADFEDISSIVDRMGVALSTGYLGTYCNLKALYRYNQVSKVIWSVFR